MGASGRWVVGGGTWQGHALRTVKGFTNTPVIGSFCSVVVFTFASHVKGPRFKTGQKQLRFLLRPIPISLAIIGEWLLIMVTVPDTEGSPRRRPGHTWVGGR